MGRHPVLIVYVTLGVAFAAGCDLFPETPPTSQLVDAGTGGSDAGGAGSGGTGGTATGGTAGTAGTGGTGATGGSAGSSASGGIGGEAGDAGGGAGSGGAAGDAGGGAGSGGTSGAAGTTAEAVLVIKAGLDDVNEDGTTFTASSPTVWLGTGDATAASFTGLQFKGVPVPVGATILEARLELFDTEGQSDEIDVVLAADADPNCRSFNPGQRPSGRALTSATVAHAPKDPWVKNQYNVVEDLAQVVQEVVNLPGWAPGNTLCIIGQGNGETMSRRMGVAFEGGPARAPRLILRYEP